MGIYILIYGILKALFLGNYVNTAMFWHVFAPKKSCQGFAALSAPPQLENMLKHNGHSNRMSVSAWVFLGECGLLDGFMAMNPMGPSKKPKVQIQGLHVATLCPIGETVNIRQRKLIHSEDPKDIQKIAATRWGPLYINGLINQWVTGVKEPT